MGLVDIYLVSHYHGISTVDSLLLSPTSSNGSSITSFSRQVRGAIDSTVQFVKLVDNSLFTPSPYEQRIRRSIPPHNPQIPVQITQHQQIHRPQTLPVIRLIAPRRVKHLVGHHRQHVARLPRKQRNLRPQIPISRNAHLRLLPPKFPHHLLRVLHIAQILRRRQLLLKPPEPSKSSRQSAQTLVVLHRRRARIYQIPRPDQFLLLDGAVARGGAHGDHLVVRLAFEFGRHLEDAFAFEFRAVEATEL
mmetsp:Transcript_20622/g.31301  ORF Transcript_20622/g.31301 Transcript_20622/m.31301 type:complete len:248 (-) Transcript_20622:514-1257(-)